MARENLSKEQKATIEAMAAECAQPSEIAKAVGKTIETVKRYINGHIFDIREKGGKMPDGTPMAGRTPKARPKTDNAPATQVVAVETKTNDEPWQAWRAVDEELWFRDVNQDRILQLTEEMQSCMKEMLPIRQAVYEEYNRRLGMNREKE